ncbi:MAG: hypothetical protein HN704_02785 [Bacteroidetes bacterium]|nr:hypothetical protein [Bacteroidota bacterium]MBT6687690.1 hypothetical protein [Bacteroidota bacterium]MBT7143613.1 hypothetical protein [Bacteroidota bacterium]MBT7490514.1 hypothetical protein [Bacteroidota bacterium]
MVKATPKPYIFAVRTSLHTFKNCKKVCLANLDWRTGEIKHENLIE